MCVCMCSLVTACLLERDPYTVLADPHYVGVCRVIPRVSLIGGTAGSFQRRARCISL